MLYQKHNEVLMIRFMQVREGYLDKLATGSHVLKSGTIGIALYELKYISAVCLKKS